MSEDLVKELRERACRLVSWPKRDRPDVCHCIAHRAAAEIEQLRELRDALRDALQEAWDRGYLKAKVTSDYELEERVYALLDDAFLAALKPV